MPVDFNYTSYYGIQWTTNEYVKTRKIIFQKHYDKRAAFLFINISDWKTTAWSDGKISNVCWRCDKLIRRKKKRRLELIYKKNITKINFNIFTVIILIFIFICFYFISFDCIYKININWLKFELNIYIHIYIILW